MSIFSRLFKKQKAPEELTSPKQLSKGDMLNFDDHITLPENVRGQTFKVQKVATYFYSDVPDVQFVIKGSDPKSLFLSIDDSDDDAIVISKKLKNKEVDALFGWDTLRAAMKNEDSRELNLTPGSTADAWTATSYTRRVFGAKGHYFEKDIRHSTSMPPGGEPFKYFEYYSEDENKSLEIEVWEGDEIEVCLNVIRPIEDIVDQWKK